MNTADLRWDRLAIIAALAERFPGNRLGRTALMKCAYFLQEARGVPLGYEFTLYSYGPFDSAVLGDLTAAELLGAVTTKTYFHSAGYGYEITPGPSANSVKERGRAFLEQYTHDIEWVAHEFGSYSGTGMELASTALYVDQEACQAGERLSFQQFGNRLRDIKPRFSEQQIQREAEALRDKGLLKCIAG